MKVLIVTTLTVLLVFFIGLEVYQNYITKPNERLEVTKLLKALSTAQKEHLKWNGTYVVNVKDLNLDQETQKILNDHPTWLPKFYFPENQNKSTSRSFHINLATEFWNSNISGDLDSVYCDYND